MTSVGEIVASVKVVSETVAGVTSVGEIVVDEAVASVIADSVAVAIEHDSS